MDSMLDENEGREEFADDVNRRAVGRRIRRLRVNAFTAEKEPTKVRSHHRIISDVEDKPVETLTQTWRCSQGSEPEANTVDETRGQRPKGR